MNDELQLGIEWGDGWVDPPESEEAQNLLQRWTKYNRAHDDRGEIFPVKLGEGLSLVAVQRPDKGTTGLVLRQLEETVDLGEGKTFYRYSIAGIRPVRDGAEAREVLNSIRKAYDLKVARDIDGFGDHAEPTDEDTAETVGF